MPMTISSTAFQHEEAIPAKHSKNGGNISPPLTFSDVPGNAKSLLLIVEDPDAPSGTFTHWIVYDMSPATMQIEEGGEPLEGREATNDFGNQHYDGPRPPSGTHRYHYKLFALDDELRVGGDSKSLDIYKAMDGHLIEKAELIGTYTAEGK